MHIFADGFFESDQFGAAIDRDPDHVETDFRHGAETEYIGLQFIGHFSGIGTFGNVLQSERIGRRIEHIHINITESDNFEIGIGFEGRGVVFAAFAGADNHYFVLRHV